MRHRMILVTAPLIAFAAIGIAFGAADKPLKGRMTQMEAKPAATAAPVVATLDSARWTATTYEAAATEANKKVLSSGKAVSVTGEVVDVSCYLQLGKRGEAHIACGTKCIEHGQPIGLVDAEQHLYILFPEEHHPRRDGEVSLKDVFKPLLAKTVTVSGMMTEMGGFRALFVRALPLIGDGDKEDEGRDSGREDEDDEGENKGK